jgi:uncharacterized protein (TIGR03435 family)
MKCRLCLLAALAGIAAAQTHQESFEVASLKRNNSGDGRMMLQPLQPGGRFNAVNIPVKQLILRAYRLQDFQLAGAPGWVDSERYDVTAQAGRAITPEQLATLLQNLLRERFALAAHHERREATVSVLVLSHKDGQLGPKLKRSTADCQGGRGPGGSPTPPPGPPPGPGAQHGGSPLGPLPSCGMRVAPFALLAGGTPISGLANALSQLTRRTVTNATGLAGNFDIDLQWTPDENPFTGPPPPGAPPFTIDLNGPPLPVALQEQLGLKLESRKESVDFLVIDKLERPTEN